LHLFTGRDHTKTLPAPFISRWVSFCLVCTYESRMSPSCHIYELSTSFITRLARRDLFPKLRHPSHTSSFCSDDEAEKKRKKKEAKVKTEPPPPSNNTPTPQSQTVSITTTPTIQYTSTRHACMSRMSSILRLRISLGTYCPPRFLLMRSCGIISCDSSGDPSPFTE